MAHEQLDPDAAQTLRSATAHITAKELQKAEDLVRNVLTTKPRNPTALHLLGVIALQNGKADQAASLFRQAIAEKGDDPAFHLYLGKALAALDQAQGAEKAFCQAARLGSRLPAVEMVRFAGSLSASGRPAEAETLFLRALLAGPDDPTAHAGLASALEQLGRREEAIAAYGRAVEIKPDFVEAHYNRALALSTGRRFQEAVDGYRRVVALKPDFAESYHNLGICLRLLGRLDEAKQAYGKALALNPRLVQSYNNLSVLLKEQGRFDEAIEACKRGIACNPDFVECHSNLGNLYQLTGNYEQAVAAYRRALELRPDFAVAQSNLGEALRDLGRFDQAEAAFRRALQIEPGMLRSYVDLAITLLQKAEPAAALAACEACLERSPGNTAALALQATVLGELAQSGAAQALLDFDRFILQRPVGVPDGYRDLDAFNAALVDHARDHASLIYAPTSHTTRGGRQSGELLTEPKGPIAQLEATIMSAVAHYIADLAPGDGHPFVARRPERWSLNLWATILDSGGRQVPHIHPSGWLSGVYYARVPSGIGDDDDDDHAGWIRFGPSGLDYATTVDAEVRLIEPKEGLMLLFPSYFYHDTLPFEAEEPRVSFAFDVIPTP